MYRFFSGMFCTRACIVCVNKKEKKKNILQIMLNFPYTEYVLIQVHALIDVHGPAAKNKHHIKFTPNVKFTP